jgi:spore photoproduct lyase
VTNWQPRFSHLYVERAAAEDPLSEQLRARYAKATVVWIDDYQEVFGRSGQDFAAQKASPKLILARKKTDFLYPGNDYVQDFAYPNFYYNALVLNCPYDCRYCYLQGMYPSANLVVFTNREDYEAATVAKLRSLPVGEKLHLALSYDTDLLALENLLGAVRAWLPLLRREPQLIAEVRTKSAAFSALAEETPCDRLILAWTLSPAAVAREHEPLTPSLEVRLRAAKAAQEAGWNVRLCFDPLLRVPDWPRQYAELLEQTFAALDASKIENVSVGVFRMAADYFKKVKRMGRTPLLLSPMARANNAVSYPGNVRAEMAEWFRLELARYVPESSIYLWT